MSVTKTALLVDDNSALLSLMTLLLESSDYQVHSFNSPIPAILNAMSQRYDILISDVCMPQLKGQELINKVRNTPMNADIPVILISGHPDSEISELNAITNMQFIRKPFNSDALLQLIEKLTQTQTKNALLNPANKPFDLSTTASTPAHS